eukprot:4150928-Amphidinium_carterae.1
MRWCCHRSQAWQGARLCAGEGNIDAVFEDLCRLCGEVSSGVGHSKLVGDANHSAGQNDY